MDQSGMAVLVDHVDVDLQGLPSDPLRMRPQKRLLEDNSGVLSGCPGLAAIDMDRPRACHEVESTRGCQSGPMRTTYDVSAMTEHSSHRRRTPRIGSVTRSSRRPSATTSCPRVDVHTVLPRLRQRDRHGCDMSVFIEGGSAQQRGPKTLQLVASGTTHAQVSLPNSEATAHS